VCVSLAWMEVANWPCFCCSDGFQVLQICFCRDGCVEYLSSS
jgi:hypothetical protein